MRHQMKQGVVRLTGLAMAAPLAMALGTASAQAATGDVTCDGTLKNQTVTGTVRVLDGGSCLIDHSTVHGDLKVGASANVLVFSSTVDGKTQSETLKAPIGAPGAYLNAWNSTFTGPVKLVAPWGVWLSQAKLSSVDIGTCYRAACLPGGVGDKPSQIMVTGSTLSGPLSVATGQTVIDDASVAGGISLNSPASSSTGLVKNTRTASLTLSSTDTQVCNSTVSGATSIATGSHIYHSVSPVTLGTADGTCGGNQLADITVSNYGGGTVTMNRNVVKGKATSVPGSSSSNPGSGDGDVTLSGSGNRFMGGTAGAFIDFAAHQGDARQTATGVRSSHKKAAQMQQQSNQMGAAMKQRTAVVKREAIKHGPVRH